MAPKTKTAPAAAASTPAAPAPVPDPVAENVPAVASPTTEDGDIATPNFEAVQARLQQALGLIKELQADLKAIQRQYTKLAKSRKGRKAVRPAGSATGGFNKAALLSEELCAFLGLPAGTERSRTDVTRQLTAYIKEHNLQSPDDKRNIVPDEKLTALLKLKGDENVTYFNLQRYMKPHYSTIQTASA